MRAARLTVGLFAVAGAVAAAQVFRVGVDTVLLNVTVSDAKGHPIPHLTRDDFIIFEDGVRQSIAVFERDPQPIALSLLIDSSTSMGGRIDVAHEAAVGFARRLGPNDVAQVIDFDSDTQIRQAFTSDVAALETAIRQIQAGGSTSLYTALYIALAELRRARVRAPDEIRRQAIVVLSDGEDTSSLKTYDDVAAEVKHSDVVVYAVGLRDPRELRGRGFSQADYALRSFSQLTGGRAFFVTDAAELPAIYTQIADELASQYFLGYNSNNSARDGAWRIVSARVTLPDTVVRTRAGYFGPKATR
jgi:Ca-activated chloride channel family protein